MDRLLQLLLKRQKPIMSEPAEKRFETANAMQDAYRSDWNPNPVLLKLLMNRG